MEQQNMDILQQPAPVSEPVSPELTQKPPVPLRDRVLAFSLLALGYLICRFQIHNYPLLGLVYGLVLFGLTLWHFNWRPGQRALGLSAAAILFLLSHLLTDNGPVRFFARWFALILWAYAVFCAGGNSQEERLGDRLIPECFKANVLMPFSKLGAFFTAGFSGGKRNYLKTALLILLGLGLALIPMLIVVDLLEYDHAFSKLMDSILDEDLPEAVIRRLLYLLLAVSMATLLMSALLGSQEHRMSRVLDRESWNAFSIRRRFLPLVVSAAMLIPLLLVYGLFFFSQLPLYTSAFTGVLPKGYTYADYAREGFFQLCAVCAINGLLYLFVSLFTRQGQGEGLRRTLLTVLCACSLILAATAFSKMVLYIKTYGLTPLRVYSSWAMILLTAAFLLALLGAYWRKLNISRALFLLFAVMFGFLCLVNTDAMIAEYNVRAYEEGRLDSVDTGVFWDLGDSAAPAAVRLADTAKYGEEVRNFLSRHGKRSAFDALCHGVPGLRARALCQPYWRDPAVVHVRIETEDDIVSIECCYGYWGHEHSAGSCVNADNSLMTKGQEVFFELEQKLVSESSHREREDTAIFQLYVGAENDDHRYTNELNFTYGEEIFVTLTGSAEKGYTIARERDAE